MAYCWIITAPWKQSSIHQWDHKFHDWKWGPLSREKRYDNIPFLNNLDCWRSFYPTKIIAFCHEQWFQKMSIPPPPEGFFFWFEPPNPSKYSNLAPCFTLKTFAFATHLPLGISIDLLWVRYGYFPELCNKAQYKLNLQTKWRPYYFWETPPLWNHPGKIFT